MHTVPLVRLLGSAETDHPKISQASLVWAPELVRTVQTLFKLPLYLLFPSSVSMPKQQLRVPIVTRKALRSFASGKISKALISVGRQDAYPAPALAIEGADAAATAIEACRPAATLGRPHELQIYKATLHIVAHLTGIPYVILPFLA